MLVSQSCPTLCDPMDCSPPDSSVQGFLRQEYWSGLPFPSLGDSHLSYQGSPMCAYIYIQMLLLFSC